MYIYSNCDTTNFLSKPALDSENIQGAPTSLIIYYIQIYVNNACVSVSARVKLFTTQLWKFCKWKIYFSVDTIRENNCRNNENEYREGNFKKYDQYEIFHRKYRF